MWIIPASVPYIILKKGKIPSCSYFNLANTDMMLEEILKEIDINGDGTIQPQEFDKEQSIMSYILHI